MKFKIVLILLVILHANPLRCQENVLKNIDQLYFAITISDGFILGSGHSKIDKYGYYVKLHKTNLKFQKIWDVEINMGYQEHIYSPTYVNNHLVLFHREYQPLKDVTMLNSILIYDDQGNLQHKYKISNEGKIPKMLTTNNEIIYLSHFNDQILSYRINKSTLELKSDIYDIDFDNVNYSLIDAFEKDDNIMLLLANMTNLEILITNLKSTAVLQSLNETGKRYRYLTNMKIEDEVSLLFVSRENSLEEKSLFSYRLNSNMELKDINVVNLSDLGFHKFGFGEFKDDKRKSIWIIAEKENGAQSLLKFDQDLNLIAEKKNKSQDKWSIIPYCKRCLYKHNDELKEVNIETGEIEDLSKN